MESGKSMRYIAKKSGVSRYLNGITDMKIGTYVKIKEAIGEL